MCAVCTYLFSLGITWSIVTCVRCVQYEVNGKARYEPVPEMEKRVRSMAMERLRVEKVCMYMLPWSGVTVQLCICS